MSLKSLVYATLTKEQKDEFAVKVSAQELKDVQEKVKCEKQDKLPKSVVVVGAYGMSKTLTRGVHCMQTKDDGTYCRARLGKGEATCRWHKNAKNDVPCRERWNSLKKCLYHWYEGKIVGEYADVVIVNIKNDIEKFADDFRGAKLTMTEKAFEKFKNDKEKCGHPYNGNMNQTFVLKKKGLDRIIVATLPPSEPEGWLL